MRIKKLVLSCLLASIGSISTSTFADDNSSATQGNSYCTEGQQGSNCLSEINTNTYYNGSQLKMIADYLQQNLGLNSDPSDPSSSGSKEAYSPNILETFSLAVNSLIGNSPLAIINETKDSNSGSGSNNPTQSFQFANGTSPDGKPSDDTTQLNNIQKTEVLDSLNQKNYFTTPDINNGFNPVKNLDSQPYSFPRSSQTMINGLGSLNISEFLRKLYPVGGNGIINKTSKLDVFTKYCPNGANCISPYVAQSTIAGYAKGDGTDYNTKVPEYMTFMKNTVAPKVLPSLNLDSLLNPLSYNSLKSNSSSSDSTNLGLYGTTDLSVADNFIRYLSGELLPNKMSNLETYQKYESVAGSDMCLPFRIDAAMKVKVYRTMIRNYAAQLSVGTSNLYHLMGKRRINPGSTTSQMEQEFKMATHRLFNPNSDKQNPTETKWVKDLSKAKMPDIQRQMAMLLAEINYQLFLNRKEQERILVTLSAMQLANNAQQKKQLTLNEAASYVSETDVMNEQTSNGSSCDQTSPQVEFKSQ